jgi:hypothetical protein
MALVRPETARGRGTTATIVVIGIVMALYAGLRDGDMVNDYSAYVELYENEPFLVEPTFALITFLVKNFLGDNVIFLFLIYAVLAVALKLTAIERLTPLVFFSVMIWLADTFPLHELTQIRTAVATGFLLLSIKPLYERCGVRFFLLILCATLFHVSALLAFPLWFLRPGRINGPLWVGVIVVAYAMAIARFDVFRLALYMPVPYIREKVELYLALHDGAAERVTPFGMVFLGKIAVTFFLLWRAGQIATHNRYVYLLLKIMFVSIASLLVFSTNLAAGIRFYEFFLTAEILLFPLLYYAVRPRVAGWGLLVALAVLFFYIQIFRSELIFPYP